MDEIITLDYGSGGKKTSSLIEEMLVPAFANEALSALGELASGARWQLRTPVDPKNAPEDEKKFAMLKWNDWKTSKKWDWSATGYLGLAFD